MELGSIHEKIVGHRYLTALEAGSLTRESLKIFTGQQYQIIASDLRSVALLLSRHGNLPSRAYLLGVLQGENDAFEALAKLGQALGMSGEELERSEPIPSAFAYSSFVAWQGMYGSDAELAAAFTVNLADWGTNCRRMSAALKANYGLEHQAVAFFDLFAGLPPTDDAGLAVVQSGLDRGITEFALARGAGLLQGYELMFWNTMAEAASV
jgi:thiaminase